MKKVGKKKEAEKAMDEVEELLKVTEDELLLNLTLNSHTKSKSKFPESSNSNPIIDPDLDRRFRALRSKPNPDVDNLFARFAALKPPHSTTQQHTKTLNTVDVESQEEEEDEVQKIINWAMDAARLDPSPSSDIDDQEDTYSDSDSDSDPTALPKNK